MLSQLEFDSAKLEPTESNPGRCLSEENLGKIAQKIELLDLAFIDEPIDVNTKWLQFKEKINQVVAPIKPIKLKAKEQFPWEDKQLTEKRKIRDYYFSQSRNSVENEMYQSMNRSKMKDYFASKTSKDFKNTKKYWQFYSASIKIKSDKSTNT